MVTESKHLSIVGEYNAGNPHIGLLKLKCQKSLECEEREFNVKVLITW